MNRIVVFFKPNGWQVTFYLSDFALDGFVKAVEEKKLYSPIDESSDSITINCEDISFIRYYFGDGGGEE